MNLKDDKQQNIQLELDFSFASTGEARTVGREETESSGAMNGTENPASTNRLMEEVCERRKPERSLATGEGQSRGRRRRWDDRRRHQRLLETALASHPGTTAERDLRTETGEAGGNPQTGRR